VSSPNPAGAAARPALRADGATRGDRNEAIALVVAGLALLALPWVVVADRLAAPWFWLAVGVAVGAIFVLGLGLRWFLIEGPTLGTLLAVGTAGVVALPLASFPVGLRLVEARNRMRAHALRFTALGSGLLILVVDVGAFGWGVVLLFGVSFVADHVLLRPQNYSVDEAGFTGRGRTARRGIAWDDVTQVHWRRYPGKERPPFPGGERIVIETSQGEDVEFVFSDKYGGSSASEVIAALLPAVAKRIRVLQPRSQGLRAEPQAGSAE
jgi:hypothetical protein